MILPHLCQALRLTAVCVTLLTSVLFAADAKRRFDITAADATETLPRFADQASSEIIFSPATVRGVLTNAVSGEFSASEALDLLVARTGLVATRDSATGALAVRKGTPGPNVDRAERPAPGPRPTRDEGVDEAIKLSPFLTSSDGDDGYHASSTLAGSRIKTPLQDVAAQISVFTPQLMSDLGLASLDEIYLYSTNVEGYLEYTPGGDQGTGFGALTVDNSNRIRGLGAVTILRSFFETSFEVDSYNTDRVTIASGPNAILFGLGNPGGITDGSLKQAGFRNRTTLAYRRDNFEGRRFTLDANYVLLPKKAALRLAALDADNRTFRPTNSDVNRRLYGAVTLHPFASTTVRLNGEWVERKASRASMIPAHDYVTPWLDGGRPSFDNSGITAATAAATLNTRITAGGFAPIFTRNGTNGMVFKTGNTPANLPVGNAPFFNQ